MRYNLIVISLNKELKTVILLLNYSLTNNVNQNLFVLDRGESERESLPWIHLSGNHVSNTYINYLFIKPYSFE